MSISLLVCCVLAAEPAAARPLLETFREEFVKVTPGQGMFPASFQMGDDDHPSTQPVHAVTLLHPFHIAKYEVPQNLWSAVMRDNPSRWKGPRNSVEMLNWDDAREFCRRVTEQLRAEKLITVQQTVRLPTEAEWEYCARAGSATRYSFGDAEDQLGAYAWFTDNAAGNDPPVGAKQPNPWGLYDMHGYLWEWCQDRAHENYQGAPTDGSAWEEGTVARRVLRSGSWKDGAAALTSATRRFAPADFKDDAVGLRCVLETSRP